MPIRTTDNRVKNIVEIPQGLTDASIATFIADASLLVDELLADKGMTDSRLELIERYLAAHFIVMLTERGGLTSSEVDNSADTYGGPKNGSGLAMTRLGQQAIAFDSSGTLKAMASDPKVQKKNAQFRVL